MAGKDTQSHHGWKCLCFLVLKTTAVLQLLPGDIAAGQSDQKLRKYVSVLASSIKCGTLVRVSSFSVAIAAGQI